MIRSLACAPSATQSPGSPARKPTFALVVGVRDDGFYITMGKGARAKARELGVDLVVDGRLSSAPYCRHR